MVRPEGHPPVATGKVGLLLLNLGSPDAPTAADVSRYLAQFLSDRRVVEIAPIFWKPVLHGIILPTRSPKTAANYAKIWDKAANDSPLRVITRAQATALQAMLGPGVLVDFAMRYGNPSLPSRLEALRAAGCDRLCVLPLYPQYSSATTGSALEELFVVLARLRWMPALRTLPPYHDHPAHIAALKASLDDSLARLDFVPERILLSFHGMPERTLHLGDPYHCQCQKTARLLREATGHDTTTMPAAFQSRFGRAQWLEPYTSHMIETLGRQGVKRLAVMMPGFSADCIETLEEIALEARSDFLAAGGTHFAALPCLNASPAGMAMLHSLATETLAGWDLPV